jgi:hypothetical protein
MTVPDGIMQPGGSVLARKDVPEIEIFDPDGGRSLKSSPTKSQKSYRSGYRKSYQAGTTSSRYRTQRDDDIKSMPTQPLNRAVSANIYYEKDFVKTNMLATQIKGFASKRSKSNRKIEPVRAKDRFGHSVERKPA